jgi:hypothetical protein
MSDPQVGRFGETLPYDDVFLNGELIKSESVFTTEEIEAIKNEG